MLRARMQGDFVSPDGTPDLLFPLPLLADERRPLHVRPKAMRRVCGLFQFIFCWKKRSNRFEERVCWVEVPHREVAGLPEEVGRKVFFRFYPLYDQA